MNVTRNEMEEVMKPEKKERKGVRVSEEEKKKIRGVQW